MGFFFIELILLTILYLILYNRGKAGFETLLISFGAGKRRSEDISGQALPIPPELKYAVETLAKLGFSRLGEVQVKIPGGRTVGSRLFLSKNKKVFAELTESRIVLFTSVFPDDAVAETGFPVGENINSRTLHSHTVTTGIEEAYKHQLKQVETFQKEHGTPRKIQTMKAYQDWEAMYRKKHIGRKMRRHTWLGYLQAMALVFGALGFLAAGVFWLGSDMSTIEPMLFIALVLVGVLLPVAVIAFFLPYIGDWGSRRSSR